ncbi:hypothetical protein [Scytonema sp. NUACC26]|uniref:hypothetical protein n=1 Tax=Scytonema sp. NUACC26 TaxID=3140176 RepID=UPI0038B39EF3
MSVFFIPFILNKYKTPVKELIEEIISLLEQCISISDSIQAIDEFEQGINEDRVVQAL